METTNAPPKNVQIYSGTTNAQGNFTVTYSSPKSQVPYVAPVLSPHPDPSVLFRLESSDVNGFTVKAETRTGLTVLGLTLLSFAVTNVLGQNIKVMVAE